MDRKVLDKTIAGIENFNGKFGEVLYDAIEEKDNTIPEMAYAVIDVLSTCHTGEAFEAADRMLAAVCGYSFTTLVQRIQKQDENGYEWLNESCQ